MKDSTTFPFLHVEIYLLQHYLLQILSFNWIAFIPLSDISWAYLCGFISGFSLLFYDACIYPFTSTTQSFPSFVTALSRYSSHAIQVIHFKCTIQEHLTYSQTCANHHQSQLKNTFMPTKRNPYPVAITPHFPLVPTPALATVNLLSSANRCVFPGHFI